MNFDLVKFKPIKGITREEMQSIENRYYDDGGTPRELMKKAGLGVANLLLSNYELKEILIIFSSGNNGGDALVSADYLSTKGIRVTLIKMGEKSMKTNEGKEALKPINENQDVKKVDNIRRRS